MEVHKIINGELCKLVFAKYIRKNGKIIYPKNGKAFKFYVPVAA